eukprot:4809949-Prymnesium_polylepis.1
MECLQARGRRSATAAIPARLVATVIRGPSSATIEPPTSCVTIAPTDGAEISQPFSSARSHLADRLVEEEVASHEIRRDGACRDRTRPKHRHRVAGGLHGLFASFSEREVDHDLPGDAEIVMN